VTEPSPQSCCNAKTERDQYAAAARHLAFRIRHTAYVWATTLPDTIRTAEVVQALNGIASHVPDRPELRDDLWMRIAGAYEARFENDGHPEDARHAADEAMSVIQPVLAAGQRAQKQVERLDQMATAWKERLPEAINRDTVVEAVHQVTRPNDQAPGGDPRQAAYDAVFAYIRQQPRDFLPATVVDRNAMIWHAVHAALDAIGIPKKES